MCNSLCSYTESQSSCKHPSENILGTASITTSPLAIHLSFPSVPSSLTGITRRRLIYPQRLCFRSESKERVGFLIFKICKFIHSPLIPLLNKASRAKSPFEHAKRRGKRAVHPELNTFYKQSRFNICGSISCNESCWFRSLLLSLDAVIRESELCIFEIF